MSDESSTSIESVFERLSSAAQSFNTQLANLRNSMRAKEIDLRGGDGLGEDQLFNYLNRTDLDKSHHIRELADLFRFSMHLSKVVDELVADEPQRYRIKVQRESDYHKVAERRRWSSWIHQSVRWMVGVSLAFLLYSAAVSLSERNSFFHVPIHDWLANGGR